MSNSVLQEFLLAFERSKDPLCLVVSRGVPSSLVIPEVRGGLAFATVSDDASADVVLSLLADCAKRGRWCRVDVASAVFDQRIYQAFRHVSATGHLQYQKDGETVDVPLAPGARTIVVVSDAVLSEIAIPTFQNLFEAIYRE